MSDIRLSVIVCTFERADLLEICLASLEAQKPLEFGWEVLVVDNDSRDHTQKVIGNYRGRLHNFQLLSAPERNLSVARNRGADAARGEYLIYLDDDAKVPEDYLNCVAKVVQQYLPDIFGGPVLPYYTTPKPFWFRDKYETKRFTAASEFSTTCRVTGANFIVRKDVLTRVGMFDPARGMQGRKYVIGDERKVLDTYRTQTPLVSQKVFYSLECFVYHHVDPKKLEFPYFLYRHYVGARSNVVIRKQLKNQIKEPRRIAEEFIRLPFEVIRNCVNEAKSRGIRSGDFASHLGRGAAKLGTLVESVHQHWIELNNTRNARLPAEAAMERPALKQSGSPQP